MAIAYVIKHVSAEKYYDSKVCDMVTNIIEATLYDSREQAIADIIMHMGLTTNGQEAYEFGRDHEALKVRIAIDQSKLLE